MTGCLLQSWFCGKGEREKIGGMGRKREGARERWRDREQFERQRCVHGQCIEKGCTEHFECALVLERENKKHFTAASTTETGLLHCYHPIRFRCFPIGLNNCQTQPISISSCPPHYTRRTLFRRNLFLKMGMVLSSRFTLFHYFNVVSVLHGDIQCHQDEME